MQATSKYLRISPKKINLAAALVRGKAVNEALDILKFTPKKGATLLGKILKSAAANAEHNFKQNLNDLIITEILVGQGPSYKRHLPVSRGRSHPILKFTSHIRITVSGKNNDDKKTNQEK